VKFKSILSKIILISILLSVNPAPAFSEPNNISLTVTNGLSKLPNTFISASISLNYLASTSGEIVTVEMIPKSWPAEASSPVLSIIGNPDVPTQKYESKSGSSGEVKINLNPGVSTKITGTYVYTVIASFIGYPNLTRTNDISFILNPSDVSPTPDTEAPRVDWRNSGISKTQISYGEEVSAKVRITDNVGVSDVTAYFYANNPVSGPIGVPISKRTCQRYSGDQKDGFWQCTGLIITEKLSKDDIYSIGFDAKDGAGNSALGQSIGGVTVSSQPPPSILIPTKVVIESPQLVTLDSEGIAKVQILAYVQPIDLSKLPPGRSSLDVELIFKGSGGSGCTQQPKESVSTIKEGTRYLILNYTLLSAGTCTGTFQFYGDSTYEKTNYPSFTFNVNPYVKPGAVSVKDVSLSQYDVVPGGYIYVYYWVTKPSSQSTSGLGAGIGDFGVDPGPFGDEYSSIGWTQGVVKGEAENGMYRSIIQIPKTAKPGIYKTWVFWKGLTGPIYGPNLNIESLSSEQSYEIENFKKLVAEAQSYYSGIVMKAVNLKFGDGGYTYVVVQPSPSYDSYINPTQEKLDSYKLILSKWADYEIANLKLENFAKQEEYVESFSKEYWLKSCQLQSPSISNSLNDNKIELQIVFEKIAILKASGKIVSEQEINSLKLQLNKIASSLSVWMIKLPVYIKQNIYCPDYSNYLNYSEDLYSMMKSYDMEVNNLSNSQVVSPTYIKLTFTGNNQELTGDNLYLNAIDSTGDGRGSIEVTAFLTTSNTKLMFGAQSLNYQIFATSSTPKVCSIGVPKYFLGGNLPHTKFSLIPLLAGECTVRFSATVSDRKDLSSATHTLVTKVSISAKSTSQDVYTEISDEGTEEDSFARMSVSKARNGKYVIQVDSNLESENVEITASKKGAKSIRFKANTGITTNFKLISSRNLKGYTLVLRFNGEALDTFIVK
jgi:hypothetical protein